MANTFNMPSLEELAMFAAEVFLCEPCLKNTPAVFCRHFWTLPIPSRRKDQHWGTIEEAHRQMAMLSLKRRLGIPANSTAYDEVMTERYLRADLSRTESRVGEFKRHGRFDGTTARFGLEILWEHSPVPFEDIQELHLSLVNWAAAQVWRDNTLTNIPSGLWLDNVGREQENKMGASKQKRREDDGCDHPQDERSPKRKRLE